MARRMRAVGGAALARRGGSAALQIALLLSAAVASAAGPRGASDALPWGALAPPDREAVGRVVRKATLRHRMPRRVVECGPDLFAVLIDRPELIVEVWNLMGISTLKLDPVGPGEYRATDATGTTGEVRVVHASTGRDGERLVVAHCNGRYEAPPMPAPLTAESVLVFRWAPIGAPATPGATPRVRSDLDAYVAVDRPAAQLLAKALRPLAIRTAEHNFVETMRFVSLFNRTAERNPAGMLRLANHLEKIDVPTRRRLIDACHSAAERSAARVEARPRVAAASGVLPGAAVN